MRVGNVVILQNKNTPGSQWPLGRVIDNYTDSKGFVRLVLVKTSSGNLERPVSKICVTPDQETSEWYVHIELLQHLLFLKYPM